MEINRKQESLDNSYLTNTSQEEHGFFFTSPTNNKAKNKYNQNFQQKGQKKRKKEEFLDDIEVQMKPDVQQQLEDRQDRSEEQIYEDLDKSQQLVSSEMQKFMIQLKSLETQLKIAKVDAEGKQNIEIKHQEINLDFLKRKLFRDIVQEESKQIFMQQQIYGLKQDNKAIRKTLKFFRDKIQKISDYLGVEFDDQLDEIFETNEENIQNTEESKQDEN